ncbi:uncharacterized protein ATC70_005000 [Mucor velutinosus]|uniref:Reverse transcriptase zinc-binding domain-containing protein n=1 Tax=Mucor velutinosus TaxID=708070 RepID=A0AAN7D634_9FUNG|nr:hypothetical protein ATC70_005000 [Mucor velutinosus]
MMEVAKQLINENQAGFVPGRFIAQNALRCQIIMEDAERTMNLAKKNNVTHQMPKAIGLSLISGFLCCNRFNNVNVRNLSVVGKATVLNSLILSKCWYVLRVTPFAQSNVQAIQSICTKFLRNGIFPVIPWATWTKPKPLGGLGVLDVALQQSALYFRWVQPLLHPSNSPHILDLILVMLVNKQNQSAHVQVPLLFPLTRTTGLTKQRTNTVTMIYKSVDRLKRIHKPVHLNIATALILPVKAILQPSVTVSKMPIRATQLQVKDLYQPNPDQPLQLEARKASTIPTDIRRACKKILKQMNENKVHIQPYFNLMLQPPQDGTNRTTDISFKPFIDSYDFNSQQGLTRQISTRTFRTACIEARTSSIARSNWNFFWSLSLNLVHRNVIYRFLTHTIPTKRLLHYFEIAESPFCPICGNLENAVHLLFLCSSKVSIWKAIIFEFLWPTVSIGDIIQACSSLDFENIKYVSKSYTTAHMVVLVTLGNNMASSSSYDLSLDSIYMDRCGPADQERALSTICPN